MVSISEKPEHNIDAASSTPTQKEEVDNLARLETTRRGSVWTANSRRGSAQRRASITDDVFGEITEGGPNYRDVSWVGTVVLMLKTQIGLGVLSIPAAFDALGLIPGILTLIGIGGTITWSNYIVGVFKRNHPEVYSVVDVGELIGGKIGKEFMAVAFLLWWICVAASGMSSISTAFNAISVHGACTAIFVVVAALIGFGTGSIRTLANISWLAWVGFISIVVSLFTLTVAVGIQDRPAEAPQTGVYQSDWKLVGSPTFNEGMSAVNALVFAYAGTPAFFAIASEMRDVTQYDSSMFTCQGTITIIYLVVGIVVYYYCGSFVASPALGSAGPLLKRITYGLALPGLIASTCLVVHLPAKYAFLRALKGSKHLVSNSPVHWMTWLACTGCVTVIAYIIASAVPNFGSLISLVGALLATLMSFQPLGAMWLYDNWGGRKRDVRWLCGVCWSITVIVVGTFIMVGGSYSAIVEIINDYNANPDSRAWSCADNSNSV